VVRISTDTTQEGSISYLAFSLTNEPKRRVQKKPRVQVSANDPDICGLCNSDVILFDAEANETVCSKCGVVIQENAESLGAEWGIYSGFVIESKSRTGTPTLGFHDTRL
jgi:transcription elongation factor Elf1